MVRDGDDVGQLFEKIDQKKPDLVEFRLDALTDSSILETIAQKKRIPAIATDKSARSPENASKLLLTAANAGFEFVDIDLSSKLRSDLVDELKRTDTGVIVSFHDNAKTPSLTQLQKILKAERKVRADICKVVTKAQEPQDNLTVLELLAKKQDGSKVISFAMGSAGIPSRILAPLFGAEFTFASLNQESGTAEGQLGIDDLRRAWKLLGIQ
jgi:3-dehydroquinate dehydratase type I